MVWRVEPPTHPALYGLGSSPSRAHWGTTACRSPGSIAGLRARLDSASKGAVPDGVVIIGSASRRKVRYAVAAEVLQNAADTLAAELEADRVRIDEADRLARQLAVAAQVKGLVNGPPPRAEHADAIQGLWATVLSEPEIGAGAVHLLSLVGPNDAVVVLDRAITRDIWSGAS